MTDYLKQFWAVLASLAAVAGLYVGAKAVNLTYIFWIVIPVAVVAAGASRTLRGLGELSIRIRNYPSLLRRVAEAQQQTVELEADNRRITEQISKAEERGKQIAFRRVKGWAAAAFSEPPEVVAIADEDGELAIVGKYSESAKPTVGAWYIAVTTEAGNQKGIVEITRLDEENRRAWMHCVEPAVPEFWRHLAERASYDETAPNIILVKYEIDWAANTESVSDQASSDSTLSEARDG